MINKVGADHIPYVCLAATVNLAGGQPVSMQNARELKALCARHGIPVMMDATRAVENAYFIQQREPGYADKKLAEILHEFCSYTDGCTMSGKKDPLVNIGGWLALNDQAKYEEASNLVVVYEGLHTYGGMAGRDMEAMARGIEESVDDDYMRSRIGQVMYLGQKLLDWGIPIVQPIGGHAIFLDARRFYPQIPQNQFPAQALAADLFVEGGIRAMERGVVSAGRDPGHRRSPLSQAGAGAPDHPAPRVHPGAHGRDGRGGRRGMVEGAAGHRPEDGLRTEVPALLPGTIRTIVEPRRHGGHGGRRVLFSGAGWNSKELRSSATEGLWGMESTEERRCFMRRR